MYRSQNTDIVGVVVEVSRDKSWRVRWSLAHRVHDVFAALRGPGSESGAGSLSEAGQAALTTVFNNLLNDAEAEVRAVLLSSYAQCYI